MRKRDIRLELSKKAQEALENLNGEELPEDLEWMKEHKPAAYEYICKTHSEITVYEIQENEYQHKLAVNRYIKAWRKVWRLMAEEHFASRGFMDVDMRYYQHMPDGHSFVMKSEKLGRTIKVFPRKPKRPPKGMDWMTARELVDIHYNPAIMEVMDKLEGWYDRKGA